MEIYRPEKVEVSFCETVMKSRISINALICDMQKLRQELSKFSGTKVVDLQRLTCFIQQYFQLIIILNKVHQTSQSMIILLEYVRDQLSMLSLGRLSLSIVTPGPMKELLLKIQTELSHYLKLPVDPIEYLGKYYKGLCYFTRR